MRYRLALGLTTILTTTYLLGDIPAQDGLVFVVAGDLAWQGHTLSWPGMDDYATFADAYNRIPQQDPLTPFISLPQALPVAMGMSGCSLSALRLLSGLGCLAVYVIAASRCADRDSVRGVDVLAILFFPLVIYTMRLGQITPILALSAALGAGRLCGILLAFAVAFKAWPLVILGAFLVRRAWTTLAWSFGTLGLLTLLSLYLVPLHRWPEILESISSGAPFDSAYNLSPTEWGPVGLAISLTLGAAIGWLFWRGQRLDRIGTVWAGLAMLVPLVWTHYLLVPVAVFLVQVAPDLGRQLSGRILMWCYAVISSALFFLPPWAATVYGLSLVLTLVIHDFRHLPALSALRILRTSDPCR
jgi:hypothetical protein